jgi:hypothetical protein
MREEEEMRQVQGDLLHPNLTEGVINYGLAKEGRATNLTSQRSSET